MKLNKILLNILSVICFIFGACYIFSLVFIPIGIYCFSAGKLFSDKADHLLDNFVADKKMMKAYTIFVSIACFPLGLLSIFVYLGIYGNNVKVQTSENIKIETIVNCAVEEYKDYESSTLKDLKYDSPEILCALYPELKSNSLVSEQMTLYVNNNQIIKDLKITKLNYRLTAWWLYFGNS